MMGSKSHRVSTEGGEVGGGSNDLVGGGSRIKSNKNQVESDKRGQPGSSGSSSSQVSEQQQTTSSSSSHISEQQQHGQTTPSKMNNVETHAVMSHRQTKLQAAKDYEAAVKRSLGQNVHMQCIPPVGYDAGATSEDDDVVICQLALATETADQDA